MRMDEIYDLQAQVLKILANPLRLEIIHHLADHPWEVRHLADQMRIAQPNLSQHLALMRAAGVVDGERVGREVRYRLTDPDIVVACGLMRAVVQRRVLRLAEMTRGIGAEQASVASNERITRRRVALARR
jgi:DNA-binding transcriptional ArsR family regulator